MGCDGHDSKKAETEFMRAEETWVGTATFLQECNNRDKAGYSETWVLTATNQKVTRVNSSGGPKSLNLVFS